MVVFSGNYPRVGDKRGLYITGTRRQTLIWDALTFEVEPVDNNLRCAHIDELNFRVLRGDIRAKCRFSRGRQRLKFWPCTTRQPLVISAIWRTGSEGSTG